MKTLAMVLVCLAMGCGGKKSDDAPLKKDEATANKLAEEGQEELVRVQFKKIESAIAAYRLKHGERPKTLLSLTKGDEPYLDTKDVFDPWENLIQMDSSGKRQKDKARGVADIFTVTPSGRTIGNWQAD